MHHRPEQLRLAIALAHVVPGARLELVSAEGRRLHAGSDPSCDLDICTLRQVVLTSAHRSLPDPSRYLATVEVAGTLQPDAAGLHRGDGPDGPGRWFATLLPAGRVAELLAELPATSPAEQAITAALRPDPCLGVTVVGLGVDAGRVPEFWAEPALDQMALAAHGRCLVEELLAEARRVEAP